MDQFVEIVFGTNFPKLLMMAEIKEPKCLGIFWFLNIGCVGNHLGTWLNIDCEINWIEFESDIKSPNCQETLKHVNWVWFW